MELGRTLVAFAGTQHSGRPLRLVRRVGVFLGLKTYSVTMTIHFAAFARHTAVQEITRLYLYPRFRGAHFYLYSRLRTIERRSLGQTLLTRL